MPARLREEDDLLILKLGGDAEEFQRQKAAAKTVSGYRWNPDRKTWDYRNSDETLLSLVHRVEPELTAPLQARVQEAAAKQSEQLVTSLPDDAALALPWADRLAPKQRAGIDFMAEHPRALLADDLGAGKSVQSIGAVYEYLIRDTGRTDPRVLIVAPNAVTGHWRRELRKWAGQDATIIRGGPDARAKELEESEDWTIINHEKLPLMIDLLKKVTWDAIIVDEAHAFKNYKAKRTKALFKIHAPLQIAASGTPVLNHPGEVFPLLKWLEPEAHTSYWAFFYRYCEFYEGARNRKIVTGVKNADDLRFVLANKLVRRTKREIHPEIPEPFDPIIYEPEMKHEQKKLYQAALKDFWLQLAEEAKPEEREELAAAVEQNNVLMIPNAAARTVRLRQIATSPALLGNPDESGKLDEIVRIVRDGGEDRPWVWFCWFRETVDLLVERFTEAGLDARGFKGGERERAEELTEQFQAGEFQIIVCTIKSGGEGIELFRAADCGFAEEEYTPARNQQAFDRIDRKGQTQRPQRHIVRTPGTVETGKIAPAQGVKKLITQKILGR